MATTIKTNTKNTYYAQLTLTEGSYDIANNTSPVSYSVKLYSGNNNFSGYTIGYRVKINGVQVAYHKNSGNQTSMSSNSTKKVVSGKTTVTHNADGTKTISASVEIWTDDKYYLPVSLSGSGSMVLATIPRATTPTLTPSTVNLGESVTINLPRATTSFTHNLSYSIGSASGTIATGAGASHAWTVPLSLAEQIPNSTTGTVAITCNTYNGTALIGTKNVNLKVAVPSEVAPTITGIAYKDVEEHLDKYGGYVQGKSIPMLEVSATAQYSSIKQYKATYKGVTYSSSSNEVQLGLVAMAGTNSVTINAIDGRERTAELTETITVLPYSSPTVRLSATRCNADGTLNDEGEFVKTSCYVEISPINNINSKNTTLYYKKKSETEWNKEKEWSSYSVNEDVILPADTSYSYDIMLEVSDDFSQPKAISEIGTAEAILDFNSSGKGMAIGKVSEIDGLEVGWSTVFKEDVFIEGDLDAESLGGTVEITSGEPVKKKTVLTLNPDSEEVNLYTAEEIDNKFINKVLWSGGWYMTSAHTANLNEAISAQPHGIVLVWSAYASGASQDYYFHYHFIPKHHAASHNGVGVNFEMASNSGSNFANKYLYIRNTSITGHDDNNTTKAGTYVTYTNNNFVLRYVIGV